MTNVDGRSERERMVAGEPYNADDPELRELNFRAMRLTEPTTGSLPNMSLGAS